MPRPRIRPEDRQRAVKACIPCKSAKKRCDSRIPCASCVRRNCPLSCLYHDVRQVPNRRNSSQSASTQSIRSYSESIQQQPPDHASLDAVVSYNSHLEHLQEVPTLEDTQFEAPSSTNPDSGNLLEEIEGPVDLIDNDLAYNIPINDFGPDLTTVKINPLPQSRLMLNAKGEKVFVGRAAALAFLEFLRQILSQHMGPSQFTENSRGNVMLEAQTPGEDLPEFEQDVEQKRVLADNFFLATSGILEFYSRSEMHEMLTNVDSSGKKGGIGQSVVYLALAIGGQCLTSDSATLKHSQRYFAHGQKLAFEGMLEDPSIKLVHSFLLMAFYLFGSCRRNAAFMYVGVAARAAHALGLHEADQYHVLSTAEQNLRLRTWKSLRILDVMASSILARPFASSSTHQQSFLSIHESKNHKTSTTLDANFELSSIIEDVLSHTSQQTHLDTSSTQTLLRRLTQWSVNLSPEIRLCSIKQSIISSEHGMVVGNIHVACLYYFTVMLLTRPFLIQYLISRLPNLSGQVSGALNDLERSEMRKLAQVCIDAAVFMAQICQNALSAGLLLDNMCILKAWIFGAGLVLGFTMFANVEVSADMESAFAGARDVLKKFSYSSPQAAHYHDVLSKFSEAITKRREHIAQERRRATSQYVDQILIMNFQDSQDRQCVTPAPGPDDTETTALEAGSIEDWWNLEFPLAEGILDNAPDVLTANWDAFALQISENFTIGVDQSEKSIGAL